MPCPGPAPPITNARKALAGSKPTSNFRHCGSRLPLTTKRKQTIALLSKLRRPLNIIHGHDRFTKFNKARGNSGGNMLIVQRLIERGADINLAGRSGVSPVAAAAYVGNDAIIEALLARGADAGRPTTPASRRSS